MAHELLTHDHMVSANNLTPWHRLGTVHDGTLSPDEAFEQARLNWHVSKQPVITRLPQEAPTEGLVNSLVTASWGNPEATLADLLIDIGYDIPVEDKFATIREDVRYPLGIVGVDYTTFQNSAGYKLVKALTGDATVETSGSLQNGRKVWVLVRIGDDFLVGGDQHQPYLLFLWSHDGTSAVTVMPTPVRVVCANTLRMALSGAKASWRFSHTKGANIRAAEVAQTLSLAGKYYDEFAETCQKLMDVKVVDVRFEEILTAVVPDPVKDKDGKISQRALTNAQTKRGEIRRIYNRSPHVGDFKGTGWGVTMAFNSYDLWNGRVHGGEGMRAERQATRILTGDTMANTTQIRELVLASA